MSGPRFNITDRIPFTHDPTEIFDIYKPSDLGTAILAPDGVLRVPLVAGARYIFHKNMTIPRLLMPKIVSPGTFELVTFVGAKIVALLFDGDDTPHIWGREVGGWFANNLQIVDISNSGAGRGTVLFDMVGGNSEFSAFSTFVVAHANFKQIGRLVDMGLFQGHISQDSGNASGFTVRVTPENAAQGQSSSISLKRFLGSAAVADNKHAAFTFIGDIPEIVITGNAVDLGKAANSFVHIDSGTTQGNYSIQSNTYLSVAESGNFFRPDLVTQIVDQVNADIPIISFADSTANPGVDTTVNFGSIVDFIRGQVILIAGATQGSFNATHTIVRVADDQKSFDINVTFATDSTATLKMVLHTVVAFNKYTRDETVTISGTTNYNGTHQILRESDTTFHLPQSFVVDDAAGTATSTGRNQKSVGVDVRGNGAQADSKAIGSWHIVGNAAVTDIVTQNVFADLNLAAAISGSNIQRWSLTNTTIGELRYDGDRPFSGQLVASVSATKSGTTRRYLLRAVKNGAELSDPIRAALEVQSTELATTLIVPIEVVMGDTIRLQIANQDATDDVTIINASVVVR